MRPDKLFRLARSMRWISPLTFFVLVILYQLGLAFWIHQNIGHELHFVAEILFYGGGGALMAFLLVDFFAKWREEKETSDLQAQVLEQTREYLINSRRLSDSALQTLYAASVYLASLKPATEFPPNGTHYGLQDTEDALDRAIQQLRDHLEASPDLSGYEDGVHFH